MVTIKDVAERAGVPVRMAARALSGTTLGKRRDARERAERIRQAAKELGYCPSEIAVSLTRGRTRTLGLLLPSLTDMFYAAASEIAIFDPHPALPVPSGTRSGEHRAFSFLAGGRHPLRR